MQNLHIKRPLEPKQAFQYRGRFAPSPSGLLHFGSLIAALASFLDAKAFVNDHGEQGKWLIRIEDIDRPREQKGASTAILTTLEAFGLHWDETALYQSTQSQYYRDILSNLAQQKLSYYCQCTRSQIKAIGGIYQGHCRTANYKSQGNATRLVNQYGLHQFNDLFQDHVVCNKALANEDFIIHRKDGLFAYQLAVVADDIAQGITHVVRGCDLLEPTARQLTLFQTLNNSFLKCTTPRYGHIPLAITSEGYKLSKQNKAPAINNANPQPALIAALIFLGQKSIPDLVSASVEEIIQWAITHWQRDLVPKAFEINID
ncbi:tRNA glutamyl-Q(34) synthetase GluQRS [Colwellia psychrerythraea]|uniref:Glutamyl-Q tRNA(Asp) synthetase n=1 Tax=Colwellia psychrerythraea (strain 34H / ATCC BAA-681) TaxID=167879 RepID=GLUQ_COLP3|nr:tRNA glutamyl-Q(34) synthetase GluQRS [Colwellia psychrerythraea]Q47W65.1 RecName: Full=Glutamyl-Q tRNA(Asp) synthetase; Short=Glu-Q-RSs [Colwellia psychrerythraea 34H]AAZ27181.1 tRNA synthetases class I family protein [Colwellia psychrerythraea 34H]